MSESSSPRSPEGSSRADAARAAVRSGPVGLEMLSALLGVGRQALWVLCGRLRVEVSRIEQDGVARSVVAPAAALRIIDAVVSSEARSALRSKSPLVRSVREAAGSERPVRVLRALGPPKQTEEGPGASEQDAPSPEREDADASSLWSRVQAVEELAATAERRRYELESTRSRLFEAAARVGAMQRELDEVRKATAEAVRRRRESEAQPARLEADVGSLEERMQAVVAEVASGERELASERARSADLALRLRRSAEERGRRVAELEAAVQADREKRRRLLRWVRERTKAHAERLAEADARLEAERDRSTGTIETLQGTLERQGADLDRVRAELEATRKELAASQLVERSNQRYSDRLEERIQRSTRVLDQLRSILA